MNFLYSNVDSNFTCNQNDNAYINTSPRQSHYLPNFSTNHTATSLVGQNNISNHNKEAYGPSMMMPQFYHQYHAGYSQPMNFLPDQLAQHYIVPSHGQDQHTIKYLTNCQPLNFQGAILTNVHQQSPSQNYFYRMPSPEVTYPANFLPQLPFSNQLQTQLSTSDVISLDRVQSSTARVSKRIPIVNPITNEEIKIESLLSHNSMLKLDGCENVNSLTHVALCTVNQEHHEVEISQLDNSLTLSSFHQDVNKDLVFNSSQLSIVNVVSETSELDVVDSVFIGTDMNEENTTSAERMTSNTCAQKETEDNGHASVNTDHEEIKVKEKRKYKYDRDFLYSLRTKGAAVQNLKLHFNVPRELLVTSSLSRDILPSYPMCEISRYIKSASPNQRVIEIHRDKVELHKAEEAYKVAKKMDHGKENVLMKSGLEREMRSVLNKITPENFDICFQRIVDMNVETQEDLMIFINILFEKATLEEYYAVTFAKLCYRLTFLSTTKRDFPPKHPRYANFRALLLQKCQVTFQTKLEVLMANERNQWRVKVNAESDEKKKMQLEECMEEKVKKVKDRFYGNIKFIGELFVQKLLNNQIIESCVEDLLTACDTQSLECLCKLLTVVGIQLDKVSSSRMNHFFDNINRLIAENDCRVDARIRCKLMDVCEMRQNGWQLRQRQQMLRIMPMTKKEFELAEKSIQLQKESEISELKKQTKQFSQHHNRSVVHPIDASKMVLKQCSDGQVDNLLHGPAGGRWKAGSGKQCLPEAEKNSSPLSSGGGTSDELDYPYGKFVEKSMFENLYDLERTNEDEEDKGCVQAIQKTTSILSEEKFKFKCLNLWREFVDAADEENTLHCFEELRDQPHVHNFVFYVVEKLLDCKKELHIKGGQLFLLLLKKKMINENIMVEGFFPILQSAEDTLMDTPDLWCYLAHILFPLVNVNINLSFMNRLLSPLAKLHDGCVRARVLSHVVHLSSIELGKDIVKKIFETSGLCWSDFLDGVNENDFLCQEGLEYMLINGVDSKAKPMESDQLYELFLTVLNRTMSNEEMSNLVEKELATHSLDANAKVVCALLRIIVVQSFINDEFHVDFIRKRASLITKLADVQLNLAHCLLDTAYMTMVRQSSTVQDVQNLLDALLQCNVISEEALLTWRHVL